MNKKTIEPISEKLKMLETYGFECEACSLENCLDWIELKEMIEAMKNG